MGNEHVKETLVTPQGEAIISTGSLTLGPNVNLFLHLFKIFFYTLNKRRYPSTSCLLYYIEII